MTFEGQDRQDRAYRPEIDGMRAIAVLAVMAYHAHLPGAGGGFVGVDVFLVISGYLITGILLRQMAAGEFSLRSFYERRARRILPALYVVLAACVPVAFFLMIPSALRAFGTSLAASALFSANFYFWQRTGGYFDDPAETMPLLHLWSLAVEEQFYLLYPPVLMLVWRFRRAWTLPFVLAGVLLSLALSEAASLVAPSANFFLLPTRGWELLAGAALALWEQHRRGRTLPSSPRAAEGAAVTGLLLLVASLVVLDRSSRFPGLSAVPVVVATLLLIAFTDPARWTGRLLASRVPVAVGLISYSAYLWHQPLLAFARVMGGTDRLSVPAALAILGVTLAIAFISWRWIERPFRRGLSGPRTFAALAAAVGLSFVAVGTAFWWTNGVPQRFPPETLRLLDLQSENRERLQRCMTVAETRLPGDPACLRGSEGPIAWAFVGDSHAAAVAPAFDRVLEERRERALVATVSACAPVLRDILAVPERGGCTRLHQRTLDYLLAHPEVHTIVFAARWNYYLERSGFDNGEGGVEEVPAPALNPARRAAIGAAFAEMPRRLLAAGRRVVLVYHVPEAGWSVPLRLFRRQLSPFAGADELSVDRARVERRSAASVAALDRIGAHPRLVRLYPARSLCTSAGGTRCALELDGRPLYSDPHHLTPEGARIALPALERRLPARQ